MSIYDRETNVFSGVYKHLCEHAYKETSYTLQFLNCLSIIMVPIKVSAMMTSNKVYITCKNKLAQFTGIVTT